VQQPREIEMIFQVVYCYSKLYGFVKDHFRKNLPGLGFALRRIKKDRVLDIDGRKMFLNHKVAVCYGRHISGAWNEPETHTFLNRVISKLNMPVAFVDVGANIGEMVIDASRHENVTKIFAFEPIADCTEAIKKSLDLNHVQNYSIIQKLVGSDTGVSRFGASRTIGGSSILSKESSESGNEVAMTTLDLELLSIQNDAIILIDVEGYEPQVLKGGLRFIEERKPLIIFEYNHVSKMHFKSGDIQKILGDSYSIFRLRSDAMLDNNIENAWNCVAISKDSNFSALGLIR
jgi:FkbM family methyltransferase